MLIKGHNSVTSLRKMTGNNPNLDLVNLNACSAQSKNGYHSKIVLCKVRIFSWLRNSRMASDHSGLVLVYQLGRCLEQSRNSSDKVKICQNCTCAKLERFGENAWMCIYFLYLF